MLIPITLFVSIAVSILIIVFLLDVLLTGKTPLVTTPKHARETLIKLLGLTNDSVFYDLGSGTGTLLLECVVRYPSTKFIGVDSSPFSYIISKIRAKLAKPKNVSLICANFFNVNLSQATHIYLWVYIKDMDKLLNKLENELKPGALVYALDFPFSNKKSEKTIDLDKKNRFGHTLYIYRF